MRVALFCCICLGWAPLAVGQPTHAEAYESIAAACLASVTDSLGAYGLAEIDRMPFLVDGLSGAGLNAGHTVYQADSLGSAPVIRVHIVKAGVSLVRARRRRLARTVTLGLEATVVAPDRRVIDTIACEDTYSDTIRRSEAPVLATDAYPDTQSPPVETRWVGRFLEPTIAAGAAILGAYLFFTLRSERAEDS
ncbi:MAG: hypothetical protein R2834_09980 [Rhodothermales bacterium]